MLKRWNEEYGGSRLIQNETFGTRLIFTGVDHYSEIPLLNGVGADSIAIPYQMMRSKMNATEDFDFDSLVYKSDVVVLDSCSSVMLSSVTDDKGLNNQVLDFVEIFELFKEKITFGVAPVHAIKALGVDYYLDLLDAIIEKDLAIFPVINKDLLPHAKAILDKFPYAIVDRDIAIDFTDLNALFKLAKTRRCALISYGLDQLYQIEKFPFYAVMTSAWKNGSKNGATYLFENGKLTHYSNKDKDIRKTKAKVLQGHGADIHAVLNNVHYAVDSMNATEWLLYGQTLAKKLNGVYWLTDIEIAQAQDMVLSNETQALVTTNQDATERALRTVDANREITGFIEDRREGSVSFIDPRLIVSANCNDCHLADVCPKFLIDATCAYKSFAPVKGKEDLENLLGMALGVQNSRVQQMVMSERLRGNKPTQEVSKEIDRMFKNAKIYNEITKAKPAPDVGGSMRIGVETTQDGFKAFIEGDRGIVQQEPRPTIIQTEPFQEPTYTEHLEQIITEATEAEDDD